MSTGVASIQDLHLPVEAIEGGEAGVLVLRDHRAALQYRAIMEVSGIPLADLPAGEQEAALSGYAAFLNSLAYPIQLVVRAQPIDLAGHVAEILERAAAPSTPPELAELAQDYAVYVQGLGARRTLLARRFFLVVPATPAAPPRRLSLAGAARLAVAMARRRGPPADQLQQLEALAQLRYRCDQIRRQLLRCGMVARRLTEYEVTQLYRQCWSPNRAHLHPLTPECLQDLAQAAHVEIVSSRGVPHLVGGGQQRPSVALPDVSEFADGSGSLPGDPAVLEPLHRGRRTIADVIAPASVELARDHLRLDEQYVRTLVVTGYPRTVGPGWLAPLVEFDGPIELSQHVLPLDTGHMVRALHHKLVNLHSSQLLDARAGKLADPERETAMGDIAALRDALQRGEEKAFSVSFYLLLRAQSLAVLDDLTRQVEGLLDGMLADCRVVLFEQDAGLHACFPEGVDRLRACRNLDTTSLALGMPFCSDTLSMERGVLYGIARHTNTPVLIDPFDPSLENANLAVISPSGSGKSYFTKLMALRNLLNGVDFLVIDPEDEYRRLCQAAGGQYIRIASTSAQQINPFDLPPPADADDANDHDEDARNPVTEQVMALLALLELMLAAPGHPLSPEERATLDRVLYETYARSGISPDDPATHSRPPEAMPRMRDLYEVLSKRPQGAVGAVLADKLRRYVHGSLAGLFASHTNVSLDRRLVVFNLQALETELRPLAIHTIAAFVWGQIRRHRRPRMLVVDEAWSVLQYPEGGAFLASMARRARKYYLGLVTISQATQDYTGSEYGRIVLGNAAMQFLLKQKADTIDAAQETFKLTAHERRALLAAAPGEGLFYARGSHVALRVVASPAEHRLATTNPRELDQLGTGTGAGSGRRTPAAPAAPATPTVMAKRPERRRHTAAQESAPTPAPADVDAAE